MMIDLENRTAECYRELICTTKRIQESLESVVPDTNEDIGKIITVQNSVLLKGKEATGHSLCISGEVQSVLVYLTEDEESTSFLRLTKMFQIEYDMSVEVPEDLCQVALRITNSETRILNTRKVALTLEIQGDLCCYVKDSVCVGMVLPEGLPDHIHTMTAEQEMVLNSTVCEKTFAFNEQFPFPAGKPTPNRLLTEKTLFRVTEAQQVGSRIIIKGKVSLSVSYLSDEVDYPVHVEFKSPFSQIVEIGGEESDHCVVTVLPTSAYYELVDTINGEKALDTELHAVMQLLSRRRVQFPYVVDAYSNREELVCRKEGRTLCCCSGMQATVLRETEELTIAEDCADVLAVFPTLSQVNASGGNVSAAVLLDIIYRKQDGRMASVRRLMNPETKEIPAGARLLGSELIELDLHPEGKSMQTTLAVDLIYQSMENRECQSVSSLEILESEPGAADVFPALTLVRWEGESLWQLAKTYRSSTETIRAVNALEDKEGALDYLLIPREI